MIRRHPTVITLVCGFLTSGCETEPPTAGSSRVLAASSAIRAVAATRRGDRGDEEWMHELAKEVPGFAGATRDAAGGILVTLRRDPAADRSAEVSAAIARRPWLRRGSGRVRVSEVSYSFVELAEWRGSHRGSGLRQARLDLA